ncbi:L-threonate dehydrogenase [Bradyrhizobium sp. DASA03076]|uniref:L-threonate dehydrogenase n=1 Tax=Bradyrhizobium sp. BLXBL-03 TaxID=3395916 RepID=UPI003F709735
MSPASARARTGTVRTGRYPRAALFQCSFRYSWPSCLLVSRFGSAAKPCYSRSRAAAKAAHRETFARVSCMSASTTQNQRIAVIGLGSMGYGMATSLKRAGHTVTGCDVSADAVARFVKDGGAGAATPAEAAKGADIVVSVVVNAAQTETILFGKDGVAETLPKDSVFISSATMDPDVARRLAKQLEATGRHYLDAPISGGAQRAAQGELTILASGSAAAFAKARSALDAMAAKLYELGDAAGQGAAFKMINQLLAGVHIAAASEAMAFAAKQGLDIRKVYEVITASAGNSWMFENRMPHVLDGDYTPRSAVEIFVKDLGIIQDMARSARFPVPVSAAALQMFLMTSAAGMGRDDDASVARMYAQVTGVKLPGDK